jgi:hypothetical protein
MFLHKLYDVDREVLTLSDVVWRIEITIDPLPFDLLDPVTLLADKANPRLTSFNLGQLFDKIFFACTPISGLGCTVF